MHTTDFLRLLDELLEQEPGTLHIDTRLEACGWSSLAVVGFMALVDEHFETTVSPGAVARCETVSDLVGLLGGRIIPLAAA